jgi:hypothetical protein
MTSYHSPEKLEKMKLKNKVCVRCLKYFKGFGKSRICDKCNRRRKRSTIVIKPYKELK